MEKCKTYLNDLFLKENITSNFNLEEGKNIFEINLKLLNLKQNRFNSFEDYLNYTIYLSEQNNLGLIKSFVENLNEDFKLNLNYIEINKIKDSKLTKEEEKEEINKINNIINKDKMKLNYKQYKKLKESFNTNLNEITKSSDKSDNLTEMIKNKIQILIDSYLDIDQLNNLENDIIIHLSCKNFNSIDDDIKEIQNVKNKDVSLKNPKEFILKLEPYMNKLSKFIVNDEPKPLIEIIKQYQEILSNSKKRFLSSILLIGETSLGKSSFLNSLIGLNSNILQVKTVGCSNVAIIIRYTENKNNITLYSAKIIENDFGFHFIEDNLLAEGKLNIENKTIELNRKNTEFNDKLHYYILNTYIKGFDDLNLRLDNKKEIELIDFPGLASNKNNYYIEKEMKKLLKNENAFIFVKKGKEINTHQSSGTVQFVYDIIKEKNFFNINNCLFLYTHLEELKSSMEEITKSLLKIFEDQTKDQCKIMRKKNKDFINKKKLIITKFDSKSYETYLHFEKNVENFRNFFEDLINESKQEKEDFYNYIDYYLISNNFRKFSENYNNTEIKKTENQQEYIKNLTSMFSEYKINIKHEEIKKFVDYYLKIKENKKLYYPFIESNYEEMLEQLKIIFNNIEIMLNETLNNQIHNIFEKIFETFNLVRIFVLETELNIDKKEKQNIKNELNDIVDKFKFSYTFLNNKTNEQFDNYEKKSKK